MLERYCEGVGYGRMLRGAAPGMFVKVKATTRSQFDGW